MSPVKDIYEHMAVTLATLGMLQTNPGADKCSLSTPEGGTVCQF